RPPDRPAGDPPAAGAVSPHRPGRATESDAARRNHRQPRRPTVHGHGVWLGLLPLPGAAASPAARGTTPRATRSAATGDCIHAATRTVPDLRTCTRRGAGDARPADRREAALRSRYARI